VAERPADRRRHELLEPRFRELLNDRLIGAGKSVLGFLNPFLYSTGASALNDITTGSNPGCNTNGFPVAAGWDPVNSFPFYGR